MLYMYIYIIIFASQLFFPCNLARELFCLCVVFQHCDDVTCREKTKGSGDTDAKKAHQGG